MTPPGLVTRLRPGDWRQGRARHGTAQVYVYLGARDERVIAAVVRLDKGHTEGLEPNVTEERIRLMVSAQGGTPGAGQDDRVSLVATCLVVALALTTLSLVPGSR
jgi:hypothetical protein